MLTGAHRWPMLDHVAPIADHRVRAEVEAEVLDWVADRAALGDLLMRNRGEGLLTPPRIALVDARGRGRGTDRRAAPDRRLPARGSARPLRACPRPALPVPRLPTTRGEGRAGPPDPVARRPPDVSNLVGFCAGDHRGKHQAPGLTHELDEDGTLTVTTPSGLVATTDPPPF